MMPIMLTARPRVYLWCGQIGSLKSRALGCSSLTWELVAHIAKQAASGTPKQLQISDPIPLN
jgi:hypothetical protein